VARSELVGVDRVVGIDRLSVCSYIRLKRG